MAIYSVTKSNGRFTLQLEVFETDVDVENNRSKLFGEMKLIANTSYHFSTFSTTFSANAGGRSLGYGTVSLSLSGNSSYTFFSGWTDWYYHNADGSLSLDLSFAISQTDKDYSAGPLSGYGTYQMTTIPRATSITATDAYIGSSSSITLNRNSGSFTHTLQYSSNGGSSYANIATGVQSDSYGWSLPTSLYTSIPTSQSISIVVKCITYSGSTEIGQYTTYMTAYVNSDSASPTISDSTSSTDVYDTNSTTVALTGNKNVFVKYFSNAYCIAEISARCSATISSKFFRCSDGKQSSTLPATLYGVESANFFVRAVDSRGFIGSKNIYKTLVDYVKLSCNANFYRPTATGSAINVYVTGNFFNSKFGNATNAVQNTLSLSWKYREKGAETWTTGGSISPTFSGNTFSATKSVGTSFDYKKSYEFQLSYSDKLISGTSNYLVSQGTPVFEWGKNDFKVNTPMIIGNSVQRLGHEWIYSAQGQAGTDGYVNIATLNISGTYVDAPITFTIAQRNLEPCIFNIFFKGSSSTDPDLNKITYSGEGGTNVYIVKSNACTWDIYVRKTQAWDVIGVIDVRKPLYMDSVEIIWKDSLSSSVPSGAIQASRNIATILDSGTWTPQPYHNIVIQDYAQCYWSKIGNMVFISGIIHARADSTSGGSNLIYGIPYASKGTWTLPVAYTNLYPDGSSITNYDFHTVNGQRYIQCDYWSGGRSWDGDNGLSTNADCYFELSGCYMTD